jgi:threonyl-tRNA synthetase
MKILQMDVERIDSEFVKPEAQFYEETKEKRLTMEDALVVFVSVEKGDTLEMAEKAIKDTWNFMEKLKRKILIIYPFAHLSNNLAAPKEALEITKRMYEFASENKKYTTYKTPFGWNKKLTLAVKGHPLAEQSRSYSETASEAKTYAKAKPQEVNTAVVKKSDWSGLPEGDHRTIGEKLDLYSFQEVSPGMTYWHPNGYIIYKELFRYIREVLEKYGYQEIATPAFANIALWHVSGHDEHYKDNMFIFQVDGQEYGLKPMNCPSTFMVYKSGKWSYRDLPIRFADFDKLYRNEISGALTGLFRVRELTQDDAHIFVMEDQIDEELTMVLRMIDELYKKFGLEYKAKLSTMPDNHAGEKADWDKATTRLEHVLKTSKIKYEVKDKEGAFYGPKIDIDVKDSIGREWQCATVQLDYQLPRKFNLEYTGEDGKQHMPIVIHRVIYGTLERFIGILTEHCQGKFPTWIAPVQARVISISDPTNKYTEEVYQQLKKNKIRAELDVSDRTLEYKIRDAQMQKIPYMIVIGKKEAESGKITVRCRSGAQKHDVEIGAFVDSLKEEILDRKADLMY